MNRRYKKISNPSNITNLLSSHIENNFKEYLIVSIVFFIGIIVGIIFINRASENQKNEISIHIGTFTTSLKADKTVDEVALLVESLKKNILLAIFLWFMGSTVVGISIVYLTIVFRGFCLGYTISSIILSLGIGKGILFIISTILFQNILFIPSIIILAVSGIRLHNSILKDRRKENIKIEIIRHTILSFLILAILIVSSLIEVYISKNILLFTIKYI